MFAYYFKLAVRSFKRNKVLTALMVLAIALGIGACMTTLTVFRVLSGDPIPEKSSQLFYVQLGPARMQGYTPGEEPSEQVTRYAAEKLLQEKRGDRQAMMTGGGVSITPQGTSLAPFTTDARYATADFFPMFQTPFLHGNGGSAKEDETRARVAVITKSLNERIFGGGNSVGKTLRLDQADLNELPERETWSYDGIVAYSKVCTHVGCPVALYEQQTHHLLCPCHQSQFDVKNHCEVIFGPAGRPLPQLPIAVDNEGYLIAQSDFTEPVGPSFWERRHDYNV